MRISPTIASLATARQLAQTGRAINRALERLSTGLRVNHPQDDIATLSSASRLDSQIRGLRVSIRNINDTKSALETANAGISSQLELVQQMRELAVQAANGTLSISDRSSLTKEFSRLLEEFNRLASDTQFNGIELLSGIHSNLNVQLGANSNDDLNINLQGSTEQDIFEGLNYTGNWNNIQDLTGDTTIIRDMKSADIDGDDDLDLIMHLGNKIQTWKNDGSGNFSVSQSWSAAGANTAELLQLADLNNDGRLDFISVHSATGEYKVHLNGANGEFTQLSAVNIGAGPLSIATGDINNDGKADLVMGLNAGGLLSVRLGNGDGTFGTTATLGGVDLSYDVELADLDEDGFLDIIAQNNAASATNIFWGNGSPSFGAVSTLSSSFPSGIEIGDFNNDGRKDFVVESYGGLSNGSLYINNGQRNFTANSFTVDGTSSSSRNSTATDLNNDGNLDLLTFGSLSGGMNILLGRGDGTFDRGKTLSIVNGYSLNPAVGDYNDDGFVDFVLPELSGGNYSANVYLSQPQYSYVANDMSIATQAKAQKMIEILDRSIDLLNSRSSELGAISNRLDIAASVNLLANESVSEARSRMMDADIAEETAELVRNQIIQQAQVAVLAQANLNLQTVLALFDI